MTSKQPQRIFTNLVLFFILLPVFLISCTNIRPISKGQINDNFKYNYSYFTYEQVGANGRDNVNSRFFKSCRVYFVDIKNGNSTIYEKIAHYSCSRQAPFKIVLAYDQKKKITGRDYFVAVMDDSYSIPITEEEKMIFLKISLERRPGAYNDYTKIRGFRPSGTADSIETLPLLKDVERIGK